MAIIPERQANGATLGLELPGSAASPPANKMKASVEIYARREEALPAGKMNLEDIFRIDFATLLDFFLLIGKCTQDFVLKKDFSAVSCAIF
jgi:hypothetical protein